MHVTHGGIAGSRRCGENGNDLVLPLSGQLPHEKHKTFQSALTWRAQNDLTLGTPADSPVNVEIAKAPLREIPYQQTPTFASWA